MNLHFLSKLRRQLLVTGSLFLLVPAAFAETVIVESRQPSGALTGNPVYQEFNVVSPTNGNWFDTGVKSAAFGLVGSGARFATNNGTAFSVTPTLSIPGGHYRVEVTHGSSSSIST